MARCKSTLTKSERPCHVGLVISHPDDEVMFFTPTITSLLSRNVSSLSLSSKQTTNLQQPPDNDNCIKDNAQTNEQEIAHNSALTTRQRQKVSREGDIECLQSDHGDTVCVQKKETKHMEKKKTLFFSIFSFVCILDRVILFLFKLVLKAKNVTRLLLNSVKNRSDKIDTKDEEESPNRLFLLCLSTGNFDGLGRSHRVSELTRSCGFLGICVSDIVVVDDEFHLLDNPRCNWNLDRVCLYVNLFVKNFDLDVLITFDHHGVSGHPNHIDTYKGVRKYLEMLSSGDRNSIDMSKAVESCLINSGMAVNGKTRSSEGRASKSVQDTNLIDCIKSEGTKLKSTQELWQQHLNDKDISSSIGKICRYKEEKCCCLWYLDQRENTIKLIVNQQTVNARSLSRAPPYSTPKSEELDVGGRLYNQQNTPFCTSVFCLESVCFWRKYLGIFDLVFFLPLWYNGHKQRRVTEIKAAHKIEVPDKTNRDNHIYVAVQISPWTSVRGLSYHWSQFVFYRFLFSIFSRFAYINTLVRLMPTEKDGKL